MTGPLIEYYLSGELDAVIEQLRAACDALRSSLVAQGFSDPLLVRYMDGHHPMAEALCALANAEAARANLLVAMR